MADELPARPIPLIYDSDVSNDVDDIIALAMIHSLESRDECDLLAVTITKDRDDCAPLVDAVNTFYGRGDVPIGVVRSGVTPQASGFSDMAETRDGDRLRYPHDLKSGRDAPRAVDVLRKALTGAEDASVVIVQVGFSTNLANLLDSPPDDTSRLPGLDLVRKKVRLASIMAGEFQGGDDSRVEYNVEMDVPSAKKLADEWPTPIVFSGYEVGSAITYPAESIEQDFWYVRHHPVAEAYRLYKPPPHCRPTWDATSVLYAVRPTRGYFELSPPGQVHVADSGLTTFESREGGLHRYLIATPEQQVRSREAIVQLASQPPRVVPEESVQGSAP